MACAVRSLVIFPARCARRCVGGSGGLSLPRSCSRFRPAIQAHQHARSPTPALPLLLHPASRPRRSMRHPPRRLVGCPRCAKPLLSESFRRVDRTMCYLILRPVCAVTSALRHYVPAHSYRFPSTNTPRVVELYGFSRRPIQCRVTTGSECARFSRFSPRPTPPCIPEPAAVAASRSRSSSTSPTINAPGRGQRPMMHRSGNWYRPCPLPEHDRVRVVPNGRGIHHPALIPSSRHYPRPEHFDPL